MTEFDFNKEMEKLKESFGKKKPKNSRIRKPKAVLKRRSANKAARKSRRKNRMK